MVSFVNMIIWIIMAPFKLLKFIVADVIVYGILGGTLSLLRNIIRLLFKPLSLIVIAGAVVAFFVADEEKRDKIKALIGM